MLHAAGFLEKRLHYFFCFSIKLGLAGDAKVDAKIVVSKSGEKNVETPCYLS